MRRGLLGLFAAAGLPTPASISPTVRDRLPAGLRLADFGLVAEEEVAVAGAVP